MVGRINPRSRRGWSEGRRREPAKRRIISDGSPTLRQNLATPENSLGRGRQCNILELGGRLAFALITPRDQAANVVHRALLLDLLLYAACKLSNALVNDTCGLLDA